MDNYQEILRKYWGYDDFRGIQREIIGSIGAGHDTLGLMPTGGGKSITFQVPALSMDGTCIVVTPLISLMKDQVDNLRRRGITAYAIYSGLAHNEIVKILDNCIFGDIKFLYVSPERLSSRFFITKLRHIHVSFITVDEAHCISQWGYDFRPAYLRIADIRQLLPDAAILALTATATPDVVKDIQHQLSFRPDSNVFRMSFRRANISYIVRETESVPEEIIHILKSVSGSAIVYTSSRKKTRDISQILNDAGIPATFYHAGLDIAVKSKRQEDWQQNITRVIVATNAFGMGIDKPDVRLVIHADVPSAVEAYFQEAGRAGRDGKRSYAVLLTNSSSQRVLHQRISQSFPDKLFIQDVYEHLAYFYEIGVGMGRNHTFLFPLEKFCMVNRYSPFSVDAALKILTNAGYIHYNTDPDDHTRLMFTVGRDDLYNLRDLPKEEDDLITELMRFYTGLFSEYVYIDESLLAQKLSSTPKRIYTLLTDLRRRHIVSFVPPRTDPKITYLIDRVDGCDVKLSDAVYDSLRSVMERHVEAMVHYIENTSECRQTQLVRYFGEESNTDCGMCEICLARRRSEKQQQQSVGNVSAAILNLLADGRHHPLSDLFTLSFSREDINNAVTALIEQGRLACDSMSVVIVDN